MHVLRKNVTIEISDRQRRVQPATMRRTNRRRSTKKVVKSVSVLPEELLIEILLRLPVPTLLRCKSVSKEWLRLLSSQYFVQTQLDHAIKNNPRMLYTTRPIIPYLPPEVSWYNLWSLEYGTSYTYYVTEFARENTTSISGSCNGLVCLRGDSSVVLCNPATREYIKVPDCRVPLFDDLYSQLGFGHDPLTNTYKLVKIVYSPHSSVSQFPDCEVYVYVYTIGTIKWRRISTSRIPFCLCNLKNRGPCLNGVVHWRSRSTTSIDEQKFYSIVGFDVGKEEFRQIPWTPTSTANQKSVYLAEIQGCLSLIFTSYDGITDIWYMKDYGIQESWTKLYSLLPSPSDDKIPLLKFLKKTETPIFSSERKQKYLYTYDRTNDTVHQYSAGGWNMRNGVGGRNMRNGVHAYAERWDMRNGVHAYVESLVSISSLYMGKRQSQRNRVHLMVLIFSFFLVLMLSYLHAQFSFLDF